MISYAIAATLVSTAVLALENDAAAPATAAPATETPVAAPAPAGHAHEAKPAKAKAKTTGAEAKDKDKDKDKKQAEKAKPAISKQAYVKVLAAEIKRHTPKASEAQIGSIHVAFTVGSGGRVVSHKVQSASNPALEPVVNQILAAVHTVTPPGGSFSAVQEFNFH
jgi:outer membrane biosynthesis protein TonB